MTIEINYTEMVLNFIKVQGDRWTQAIKEAVVEADALEIFDLEARLLFIQERVDDILGERP
jgi:hypothetical protein|tara:strand:+ start:47 stop:229 length:183 start_codon:yes stop_codon:yes gene_type:complete